MARNSRTSETAYLNAVRSTRHHSEWRTHSASQKSAFGIDAMRMLPASSLRAFTKEISEFRHLAKKAQHQIDLLVARNIDMQEELTALLQKKAQDHHLACHNVLTGLPDCSLLLDRFRQAMFQSDRNHKRLALLSLDLDKFSCVNDTLGHAGGNKLLHAVAQRIKTAIRGADTACRYGGAKFVIMLAEIDSPTFATALAMEIGGGLSEPYQIDGHEIHLGVSLGISVYPSDGQNFDDLMSLADVAMHHNKGTGMRTSITALPHDEGRDAELPDPLSSDNSDSMHATGRSVPDEATKSQQQQHSQPEM